MSKKDSKHSVFISYARADSNWVAIAVNLLVAAGTKVFMDVRDVSYGDPWEEVLLSKLREVERVLIFWSKSAALSEWVRKEWQFALGNGKRLVPVPIDDTPLPKALSQFQAMNDLRDLIVRADAEVFDRQLPDNTCVPNVPFPGDADEKRRDVIYQPNDWWWDSLGSGGSCESTEDWLWQNKRITLDEIKTEFVKLVFETHRTTSSDGKTLI
jgi:hypothetical protein